MRRRSEALEPVCRSRLSGGGWRVPLSLGRDRESQWRRLAVALCLTMGFSAAAQPPAGGGSGDLAGEPSVVRATLRSNTPVVQVGAPIWVEFGLQNLTDRELTLRVPEASTDESGEPAMGLPLGHVFSGRGFSAVTIEDSYGERFDSQTGLRPKGAIPAIRLAPRGGVTLEVDLTRHYESLQRPGKYKLTWRPYGGALVSEPLALTVLAERQAVILTDFGKMTIRFYYDKAPAHVQNFIELVEQRFYDNLTFHRVIPGGLIQGGDPRGDGHGIRKDGKRLKAEFSNIPFELGTVGMARSPRDPDSASCQFFICLGRQPSFDGQQTAFGYLVGDESFQTLSKLAAVPTGEKDRPRQPLFIRTISLENVPPRDRPAVKARAPVSPPPATRPATRDLSGTQPASEPAS